MPKKQRKQHITKAAAAPQSSNQATSYTADSQTIDYRSVGATGLKRFGGLVYEDILRDLVGQKGVAIYKEMGDNDPVCGTILYTIDKLVRGVEWRVKPASEEDFDRDAADFLESCMHDMETTWTDFISEVQSMYQYGHSVHEIVYKRRGGDNPAPWLRSKFTDGRIGWRGIPIRSQDTIFRWHFDHAGGIKAVEQQAPPDYDFTVIPMEKCLLFRTSTHKNNPEGRSIFRHAYRPWYMKRAIENIEAVGIERDLAGLPVMRVPINIMRKGASQGEKAVYEEMKNIVVNIRRDEQEGVILPSQRDASGNEMYDLTLLSSGGSRNFDTDKIVQRYDQRIAMSALADFLLLGQGAGASGSWAMHSDKTKMFVQSIQAYLDIIAQTMQQAVERLFRLNDLQVSEYPKIEHGGLESVDLKELGDYVQKLAMAGMPLFPDDKAEEYLRGIANIPTNLGAAVDKEDRVVPTDEEPPSSVHEIPDVAADPTSDPNIAQEATSSVLTPEEAKSGRAAASTMGPGGIVRKL